MYYRKTPLSSDRRRAGITFEDFQRLENDLYPISALREMLLNALVHRTYMGATIQMRVYDDRLSIWNEGALPCGLSLEDLKKEHSSRPRNPLLANACFLGGYIDAWGRGTLKIINACRDAGLPEPEMIEKNGGVSMTLFAHPLSSEVGEKVGEKVGENITENQRLILDILRKNPYASAKILTDSVGISMRKIEVNLKKLKEKNLLKRIGPAKGGHWEVTVD
jgi:ATP-dependent DNA helicase RecG